MPSANVSFEEWLSRTSVIFGRRSASLKKIDDAYRDYDRTRKKEHIKSLHMALDAYLLEKGGHWEMVNRNNVSGGLMKYMHGLTDETIDQWGHIHGAVPSRLEIEPPTRSELDREVLLARIPEVRHGILYLWESTQVEIQFGKIFLEGALSLGSTAVSTAKGLQNIGCGDTRANYYTAGSAVSKLGSIYVGVKRGNATAILNELDNLPINLQPFIHWDAFHRIKAAISEGISWIWGKIITNQGTVVTVSGRTLEKLISYILGKVCEACVPFVSSSIDLARGVSETIKGSKDRLEAYFARSKFALVPGHITQIADSLEKQMNWAIGKGLFDIIKGGAKLGMTFMTAGASTIIDAIAAGLEFATKFFLRQIEGSAINKFLSDVRDTCLVTVGDDPMRPGIVHKTVEFNDLFMRGCAASPCIPMMTLNSGIIGDQMMHMKMFDETSNATMVGGDSFNAATQYLSQLKRYGKHYVRNSGFTFSSTKNDVQNYLSHAIHHHDSGNLSLADVALRITS